ncbi:MAG: GPP34 family phosphoprotein [Candidatus Hermodarchaeota archaeon]
MLLLAEEILLVSCYPGKKGRLFWTTLPMRNQRWLRNYALVSAILRELEMRNKIKIERGSLYFTILSTSSTGESILDNVLNQLTTRVNKRIYKWMKFLIRRNSSFEFQILQKLESRGVVQREKRKNYILIKPDVRNRIFYSILNAMKRQEMPDIRLRAILGYMRWVYTWRYMKKMIDRKDRNKKWLFYVTGDEELWMRVKQAVKNRRDSRSFDIV